MITTLSCVLIDGTAGSDVPSIQPLSFEQGEACTLNLTLVNTAGTAVNLTGGSLIFTMKFDTTSATAAISRQAIIDNATLGTAHVTLEKDDTKLLSAAIYTYDIVFIDATGRPRHVLPTSPLKLLRSIYQDGQPVTVPATQQPLFNPVQYLTQDWIVYVDPVAGNDANAGTQAAPWQTLDHAILNAPKAWGQKARIMLAAGNYVTPAVTTRYGIGAPFGPQAEPLCIYGGFTNVYGDKAVTATSGNSVTVGGPLGAVNDEAVGCTIYVVSGPGAGARAMVTGSTQATGVVTFNALGTTLGITTASVVRFERPAATITVQAPVYFIGPTMALTLAFIGCKFVCSGGYVVDDTLFTMYKGVEFDCGAGNFHVTADGSQVTTYTLRSVLTDLIKVNDPFAGVYVHNDGGSGMGWYIDDGRFVGSFVARSAGCLIDLHGTADLYNIDMNAGGINAIEDSWLRVSSWDGVGLRIVSAPGDAIKLGNRASSPLLQGTAITTSAGAAVHVSGNAWASLSALSGTGNTYGLIVDADGSRAVSDGSNTVTGASGDVHVGTLTQTWALAGTTITAQVPYPSYATASRPTAASAGAGFIYRDTTLNKLGISDGTNWRDALGTII